MSELRQQMIDAMRQRGFAVRTHQAYLGAVAGLARYYHRAPDRLSAQEVKGYIRHLAVDRALSGSTCRQHFHAVRFFYQHVLGLRAFDITMALPKCAQRIPELLTRAEVAAILAATPQSQAPYGALDLLRLRATGERPHGDSGLPRYRR